MIPDDDLHQRTLHSLLAPPKAPRLSAAEQKVVNEVREEWEQQQENERLMLLEYKCSKLPLLW
jgi:hypothetical protein